MGDVLTYRVLTTNNTFLSRSVMQSAPENIYTNLKALNISDEEGDERN